MALKGQLSDFNLAEILQLIAGQQKSGFLILEAQREMVFVFDNGVLISTRDRRSESPDPLEAFLRSYGFFDDAQWKHIDFIRTNSSLDLTEILISEQLMTEAELEQTLMSVAQEMAHRGMKLRRGRYHFTATKDTPPGVRGRFRLDVQGLLMEAARRLDEEPLLLEALPSQSVTFAPGSKAPADDELNPIALRVFELALAGHSLGRIIRSGRTDSFSVREMLNDFCQENYLTAHHPGGEVIKTGRSADDGKQKRRRPKLRSVTLTSLATIAILGFGGLRWWPLVTGGAEHVGLAAAPAGVAVSVPASRTAPWNDPALRAARDLRLRQVRAEVESALALYRYRHGQYPADFEALVGYGEFGSRMQQTVEAIGWTYTLLEEGRKYSLAS